MGRVRIISQDNSCDLPYSAGLCVIKETGYNSRGRESEVYSIKAPFNGNLITLGEYCAIETAHRILEEIRDYYSWAARNINNKEVYEFPMWYKLPEKS